jgi:hypothetical protein
MLVWPQNKRMLSQSSFTSLYPNDLIRVCFIYLLGSWVDVETFSVQQIASAFGAGSQNTQYVRHMQKGAFTGGDAIL